MDITKDLDYLPRLEVGDIVKINYKRLTSGKPYFTAITTKNCAVVERLHKKELKVIGLNYSYHWKCFPPNYNISECEDINFERRDLILVSKTADAQKKRTTKEEISAHNGMIGEHYCTIDTDKFKTYAKEHNFVFEYKESCFPFLKSFTIGDEQVVIKNKKYPSLNFIWHVWCYMIRYQGYQYDNSILMREEKCCYWLLIDMLYNDILY